MNMMKYDEILYIILDSKHSAVIPENDSNMCVVVCANLSHG